MPGQMQEWSQRNSKVGMRAPEILFGTVSVTIAYLLKQGDSCRACKQKQVLIGSQEYLIGRRLISLVS